MSKLRARSLQAGVSTNPANNIIIDASAEDGNFEIKTESGIVLLYLNTEAEEPGATGMKYYQSNILDPVSQVAGIPTGGIIESGINTFGVYTKYADGTLICYKNTTTLPTGGGGAYTLPARFINNEYFITGVAKSSSSNTITSKIVSRDVEGFTMEWVTVTGIAYSAYLTVQIDCYIVIIGRWF